MFINTLKHLYFHTQIKKNFFYFFLEIIWACVYMLLNIYQSICIYTHLQKKKSLSIHITCVFYMCEIFNATNRFSAEQSIKKAPILEFIFTQCLLNYTTFARKISGTACKSTGPPDSGLVKGF